MMRENNHLLILAFLFFATLLSACSPGHIGNNEIAFVRDGHLWTIDPDGANAFEVTSNTTQVMGYTWSPDHKIFAFRTLDSTISKKTSGQHLTSNQVTGLINDAPSVINTIGIDGGTPIPITISSSSIQHSNTWWNPAGNRLLYREESTNVIQNAGTQSWWVSQNDQPLNIARKLLPYSYSIPSLSSSGVAIGNSSEGLFTTTLSSTDFHFILQGSLPGHPLPASLERVLWQPAHSHPEILYAISQDTALKASSLSSSLPVKLILRDSHEQTMTIATCNCTQFAWSPNGNSILYSTGTQYTIFNIQSHSHYTFSAEYGSVPYWSPDSRCIIMDGLHTLQLIDIFSQQQQTLLNDVTSTSNTPQPPLPDSHTLLQPVSNNIWSADSQHFLFLTRNRLVWQGKNLDTGNGLYTVSIDSNGRELGPPAIVDNGNDSQAGWTNENPDTSFLF